MNDDPVGGTKGCLDRSEPLRPRGQGIGVVGSRWIIDLRSEYFELFFDHAQKTFVFIRKIRQCTEPGHPWGIFCVNGRVGAAAQLFLKRFSKELFQGHAIASGENLGPPECGVGDFDRRFHVPIFPFLRPARQHAAKAQVIQGFRSKATTDSERSHPGIP